MRDGVVIVRQIIGVARSRRSHCVIFSKDLSAMLPDFRIILISAMDSSNSCALSRRITVLQFVSPPDQGCLFHLFIRGFRAAFFSNVLLSVYKFPRITKCTISIDEERALACPFVRGPRSAGVGRVESQAQVVFPPRERE